MLIELENDFVISVLVSIVLLILGLVLLDFSDDCKILLVYGFDVLDKVVLIVEIK